MITKQSKEDIYFQFADAMMLLCYRYVGNKEDAEELMNNAFLKVFKNLSKFREYHKNAFAAWIKKIMINECLMFLRKSHAFNIISIDDSDIPFEPISDTLLEDTEWMLNMLNELPAGYRTVFNLYAIEGYKHKEIAGMLNISENTSRTQLFKGRKFLAEIMKKQNKSYGS